MYQFDNFGTKLPAPPNFGPRSNSEPANRTMVLIEPLTPESFNQFRVISDRTILTSGTFSQVYDYCNKLGLRAISI